VNTIKTRLTVAAGVVIIALTAAAFWLSYAHLHDVAATYGLGGSMERAWAWPATLDLFIVAGEILMLVAALNGKRDPWAIGLTVAGSVGSILLNVLGVGQGAPVLTYVVAAVPPSAALLAFGALMRQLHTAVAAPAQAAQEAPVVVVEKVQEADLAPVAPAPLPEVVEELEALEEATEEPEEDDQEEPVEVPVVTQVHRITSKPSVAEIAAAVEDIQRDGEELNGYALATYFGVSDRSGRRYLAAYQAA
jgi:fructose-specific component phosphotransferase system IIB-like protein